MNRRLRGMFGMALTWGVAWAIVGLTLAGVAWLFVPRGVLPRGVVLGATMRWGVFGAVSGAAFALVLSFAERRKHSLDALSMERVTGWGALGGAILPLALLPVLAIALPVALRPVLSLVPMGSILGVASAAASLRIARRADRSLPTLTSQGSSTDTVQLVAPAMLVMEH
ncbi:MAG: hypothetical protein ABJE10_00485 [bacterium]